MDFLWDTSVLLHYVRNSDKYRQLDEQYKFFASDHFTTISYVTVGEMISLSLQFNWGRNKIQELENSLLSLPVLSIERKEILEAYAEIDTYSMGKNPLKALPFGQTAKKMGKNDLWIAATAHAVGPTFHLVTSDNDFDHLDGIFIHLIKF